LKTLSGHSIPRESFPEAASQTFKKGDLVYLNGGYLTACGADPTLIMGVATSDGHNTAAGADSTVVELAHPNTLFIGNLDTQASEGAGTTAATDRGKMYGVKALAAAPYQWYVDKTDVTNKRVIVWDIWTAVQDGVPMAVGDIIGWVVFAFDPTYFQGLRTS
jgi:hypothetical protein